MLGNWSANQSDYYNKTEVTQNITDANTSMKIYSDTSFVNITGDNMTGNLEMSGQGIWYAANGSLGVGTTSPVAKLDISKVVSSYNSLLQFSDTGTASNSETGIDWRNTEHDWNQSRISIERQGSANSFDMLFYTSKNGAMSEKVRIDEDGNVGIGTSSPQNALNVVGDINTSGYLAGGSVRVTNIVTNRRIK